MPAGHVPEPHATPDGPLSAEASIEQLTDGDVGGHTHQPAGHSAGIGFPQPSMQFKAASGLQPGRSVAASCTPVCPPHAPKATKVTAPTTDADFECGIALPYHCRNAFRGPRPLRTVRSRGRRETRNPFRPLSSSNVGDTYISSEFSPWDFFVERGAPASRTPSAPLPSRGAPPTWPRFHNRCPR
jgi:hypothetical protein